MVPSRRPRKNLKLHQWIGANGSAVRNTKKHGKSYHGYKNLVKVDAGSKLIDHNQVTPASVRDGTMAWELLDERDQGQDL